MQTTHFTFPEHQPPCWRQDACRQRIVRIPNTNCRAAGKAAIVEQVSKMYGSPLHSDVAILVDRCRIPAHRHVLSTHSKVFQRMWEHELREVELPPPLPYSSPSICSLLV